MDIEKKKRNKFEKKVQTNLLDNMSFALAVGIGEEMKSEKMILKVI